MSSAVATRYKTSPAYIGESKLLQKQAAEKIACHICCLISAKRLLVDPCYADGQQPSEVRVDAAALDLLDD